MNDWEFMDASFAAGLAEEIASEALAASWKYPPFNTAHEGLAVIWEEFEELKREVFKKQAQYDLKRMRKEALQVSAMALRFVYDVCDLEAKEATDE